MENTENLIIWVGSETEWHFKGVTDFEIECELISFRYFEAGTGTRKFARFNTDKIIGYAIGF